MTSPDKQAVPEDNQGASADADRAATASQPSQQAVSGIAGIPSAVERVILADRRAAWPFRPEGYGPTDRARWMSGELDANAAIEAFYHHRHDSLAAADHIALELLEALRFYAAPEAWNQPPVKTVHHELLGPAYENQASKVRADRGRIARAAIAKALGQ